MRRTPYLLGIAAFLALAPVRASAQGGARAAVAAPATSLVYAGRLGISRNLPAPTAAVPAMMPASLRHRGPGVAFMLVGAAGILTGLLVDESIVTIAGAGVGLYGLYLYLR